jgi:hypothetical protein
LMTKFMTTNRLSHHNNNVMPISMQNKQYKLLSIFKFFVL